MRLLLSVRPGVVAACCLAMPCAFAQPAPGLAAEAVAQPVERRAAADDAGVSHATPQALQRVSAGGGTAAPATLNPEAAAPAPANWWLLLGCGLAIGAVIARRKA